MMQIDYQKAGETAARIIERFGAEGTIIRKTQGDYDPQTGSAEPEPDVVTRAKMARLDYKVYEVDGSRIKAGDSKMVISNKVDAPKPGDLIKFFGETMTVIDCITFSPAGKVIYHQAQVRK